MTTRPISKMVRVRGEDGGRDLRQTGKKLIWNNYAQCVAATQ